MKLNTKLLFLLTILILFFVIVLSIVSNTIFMSGYDKLEEEYALFEYNRVYNEFEEYINKLNVIVNDWAAWDDTYYFVEEKNFEYIESNIVKSTFENIGLDYIIFLDNNNELIYSGQYDNGVVSNNIDKNVLKLFKNSKIGATINYINNKNLIINKAQVFDSEKERESNGIMIFAYYLSEEELYEKVNLNSNNQVKYFNNVDINTNDKFILNKAKNKMNLEFYLPYANNKKTIKIQINFSNEIAKLGKETGLNLFWFYFSSIFILVAVLLMTLNRCIVDRIIYLNDSIKKISDEKNLSKRIKIKEKSKDEIFELKISINKMLDKIENLQKELVNFATVDELTGVYNRRVGLEKLERNIIETTELNNPLTICYIDVNNLKIVNDKLGHNFGDLLILDVVELIKKNIRDTDYISRFGGDEFVLVLSNTNAENAEIITNRIQNSIQDFNEISDKNYLVSISLGIIEYNGIETLDELIERADFKMYENKILIKSKLRNILK